MRQNIGGIGSSKKTNTIFYTKTGYFFSGLKYTLNSIVNSSILRMISKEVYIFIHSGL